MKRRQVSVTKKPVEGTTPGKLQKSLTENQMKTLAALRKMGEKKRPERIKMLKDYQAYLRQKIEKQKGAQKKTKPTPPSEKPKTLIDFSLPVTLSEDALFFFRTLSEKQDLTISKDSKVEKKASFRFTSGLTSGSQLVHNGKDSKDITVGKVRINRELEKGAKSFNGSGLWFELDKGRNQLDVILRYPPVSPSVLRSPSCISQGDLMYRATMAKKKTTTAFPEKKNKTENTKSGDESNGSGFQDWSSLLSDIRLDNVAWHDFSAYHYVRKPDFVVQGDRGHFPPLQPGNLDKGNMGIHLRENEATLNLLINIEQDSSVSSTDISGFIGMLSSTLNRCITHSTSGSNWGWFEWLESLKVYNSLLNALQWDPALVADFAELTWSGQVTYQQIIDELVDHGHWKESWFVTIYEDYNYFDKVKTLISDENDEVCRNHVYLNWKQAYGRLTNATPDVEEQPEPETPPPPYPFDVYKPSTWNLGLQLVFRQEWRSLGNQIGEIVKTIPLGPKQVEKVSTRILRRTKTTHTSENLKSSEVTTETSDTSKDSSEVVKEAAESSKWNINQEVEGGYNCGVWNVGGKTSGGYESQSSESSKETSAHLSEKMQKTANKIRTETKVVVSTESESTFETTVASEIQNPNDEVSVTYIYSKLQRQYEIFTSLAEIQNVVMIAEPVWPPNEITPEWIRKYDWILAKALLDDSFRDILASFSQDVPQESLPPDVVNQIGDSVTSTTGALNTLAGKVSSLSLSQVDLSQEAQRAYRETQKEELERKKSRALLIQKQDRFLQHIRENILHYCRTIWSQEDPQQRMLRYRKLGVRVPLEWRYEVTSENVEEMLDRILQGEIMRPYSDNTYSVDGEFVGVDVGVDIADLINPAGPIGFYGNYAIYYIRPEYSFSDIFTMLQILKTPYLYYPEGDKDHPTLMDPMLKQLTVDNEGNSPSDEEKDEMIQYVPELRLKYEILGSIKAMEQDDPKIFETYYPEYLFRKEQSRRFLLETNNIVLDLFPGTGSALEEFKRKHREIDVEKAEEEKKKMKLENERRQKLIAAERYGDPDIEKVTVVCSDSTQLSTIVAGVESPISTKEGEDSIDNE